MDKVVSLRRAKAEVNNDCRDLLPKDCFQNAIDNIDSGDLKGTKALAVILDKGKDGDQFNVNWFAAGLSSSERVALGEVIKSQGLVEMGYLSEGN